MERVAGRAKTKRRRRTGRRRRGLVLVGGGGGEGGSRNGLIAILLDQDLYDIHLDYLSRRGKGGWRGGLVFVGGGGRGGGQQERALCHPARQRLGFDIIFILLFFFKRVLE